ncbi:MAG TPA: WYL domain-containing protein [Lachnoclostridium sp.]|nr:WYL domain-containing protein [Lachnoclostridium sp.]
MAYTELIKSFSRIRDYMREFFVFGFKSRDEYSLKSARSYDNERRRVESWLGEYMSFGQTETGKRVFLSVDSRDMERNPLFRAFRAKSFTDLDIVLYFYILDILGDGSAYSVPELMESIEERYLRKLESDQVFDVSTLRKKMKEFEELGLVTGEKSGNKMRYRRTESSASQMPAGGGLREAVEFFSEEAPLGVIGSYMTDLPGMSGSSDGMDSDAGLAALSHKHHYILHALDSEVLLALLSAMHGKYGVILTYVSRRGKTSVLRFCPLKIYVSTRQGRWHVYGYNYDRESFDVVRVDSIKKVETGEPESSYDDYLRKFALLQKHLWGVSGNRFRGQVDGMAADGGVGRSDHVYHVEMDVSVGDREGFIVDRLMREKRCGRVYQVEESTWRFSADVTDTREMLPWIRTFTGRITRLVSSSGELEERFYEDLGEMRRMYEGGAEDAVS